MTTEIQTQIQAENGVPKAKVKPKSNTLEYLKSGDVMCSLGTIAFWDEATGEFGEPSLSYRTQMKGADKKYMDIPMMKTVKDFEAMIKHCQSMIKIMKATGHDSFARDNFRVDDPDTAIEAIKKLGL